MSGEESVQPGQSGGYGRAAFRPEVPRPAVIGLVAAERGGLFGQGLPEVLLVADAAGVGARGARAIELRHLVKQFGRVPAAEDVSPAAAITQRNGSRCGLVPKHRTLNYPA